IFCRNVLIYFSQELAERVLEQLAEVLAPDGALVLGPSDPAPRPGGPFEAILERDAVIYRRVARRSQLPQPIRVVEPVMEPPPLAAGPSKPHDQPRRATSWKPAAGSPAARPDWRDQLAAAQAAADAGRLTEARRLCQGAIAAAARQPEPYFLLATLCET